MTTLLHIDSSPLGEGSVTRRLTRDFVAAWLARYPATRVLRRDLTDPVPPHLDEAVLASFWTGKSPRDPAGRDTLSLSDAMIGELEAADLVVVGSPMYNFTVTSTLKAWMDLVGRAGRTFRYTDTGVEGLMGGRRAVVVTARGGYYRGGGPSSGSDHQAALLDTYFRFLGLDEVLFIHAEGQGMEPAAARAEEARARDQLLALVRSDALEAVA